MNKALPYRMCSFCHNLLEMFKLQPFLSLTAAIHIVQWIFTHHLLFTHPSRSSLLLHQCVDSSQCKKKNIREIHFNYGFIQPYLYFYFESNVT